MKTDKWLYFRSYQYAASTSNDDGVATELNRSTSALYPASRLMHMKPVNDDIMRFQFQGMKIPHASDVTWKRSHGQAYDIVEVKINQDGKQKEVMEAVMEAINSPSGDGFVVIGDDSITDIESKPLIPQYISPHIIIAGGVNSPYVWETPQGNGIHEYYATLEATAVDDDDACASLPIKLQAQSVILEAGIRIFQNASNDIGSVSLKLHSAAIANDASSAGTEIVGFDAATRGEESRVEISTLTLDDPFGNADNSITSLIQGKTITQAFVTNSDNTLKLFAAAIEALPSVASATITVVGGNQGGTDDRLITITGTNPGDHIQIEQITITGTSAPDMAIAITQTAFENYYNASTPPLDLDISSDATSLKGMHSGPIDPIYRGREDTHFHLCAKEDMKSTAVTGSPTVGVYIKWWGVAAAALV